MNLNNGSVSFNMGAKQLLQQYTKEKRRLADKENFTSMIKILSFRCDPCMYM